MLLYRIFVKIIYYICSSINNKDNMEISEVEYQQMQATIKELQQFKETHSRNEAKEVEEYLAIRAATQKENADKIAQAKNRLR